MQVFESTTNNCSIFYPALKCGACLKEKLKSVCWYKLPDSERIGEAFTDCKNVCTASMRRFFIITCYYDSEEARDVLGTIEIDPKSPLARCYLGRFTEPWYKNNWNVAAAVAATVATIALIAYAYNRHKKKQH